MKIGIITFHHSVNYGAVLQAYALSLHLKSLGHDPMFINYVPEGLSDDGTRSSPGNIKMILQGWYIHLVQLYASFRLSRKFTSFLLEYLPVGDRKYANIDELMAEPPVCDAYICGSDQIWNPHDQNFDPASFLMFGASNIRRISYAASFGTPVIPERLMPDLRKNLSGLDCISVREKSGIDILRQAVGKECVRTLDPTLLKNEYPLSRLPSYARGKYLLVYRLQQSHALTKKLTALVKLVSKTLNVPVINVSPHPYRFFLEIGKTVYPEPCEWVGLIEHAAFVVTNSFHGTVFAIIYKRPFISFPRVGEAGQNGRMQELLADLGLEDRFVSCVDNNRINALMENEIDWENVEERLGKLRKQSNEFLVKALEQDTEPS